MEDPAHWDRLTAALYHSAGPSIAYQVAAQLAAAGLTTPGALRPDPGGDWAGKAWQRWRKRALRRRAVMRWLHPLRRPLRFATALGRPGFEPRGVRHELQGRVEHGPVRGTVQCHGDGVVALLAHRELGWVVPPGTGCAGWFKGAWIMAWSARGGELSIEYWLPPGHQELDGPFRVEVRRAGRQYLWVTADPTDLDEFVARAAGVLPERAAGVPPGRAAWVLRERGREAGDPGQP